MRIAACILSLSLVFSAQQLNAQLPEYKLRVDVVERSAKAINYQHRNGSTTVGFRGTNLQPEARGEAKVESRKGYVEIEVEFDDMTPATRYGSEYLTYVMWAITPQGRASNLGELILNGTKGKLNVTTDLQAFGMVVSAEPYFAVTQPSDRVVLENYVRQDTKGKVEEISARYELLDQGQFAPDQMPANLRAPRLDASLPMDLQQARNAIRIAEWYGVDRYAPEAMAQTRRLLDGAEDYYVRKAGLKSVSMMARGAVQSAEDARLIALKRNLGTGTLERERSAYRERLIEQLNRLFVTRNTSNGVIVSLSADLFESGRATLSRQGREKLSRVAGLILAHPGMRLDVSTGNTSLSRRRADAVRDYLVQQGASARSVTGGTGTEIDAFLTGDIS